MLKAALSLTLFRGKTFIKTNNITTYDNIKLIHRKCSTATFYQQERAEQIIQAVAKNDPAIENKLKVLMMEIEVLHQEGQKVPKFESLKLRHWESLINYKSISGRRKFLSYVWQIEKKQESEDKKKEERRLSLMEVRKERERLAKETSESDELKIEYGLTRNSMFSRIYETSMNKFYNQRLLQSMMFGQKLIIDCSYDKYMTNHECSNSAKQLTYLFAENRLHMDPFDLHFFNCDLNSINMKILHRNIPSLIEPWFPLHIHTDCFTKHFPREQLVYLTPHCRNELSHYDPNVTYIVGCMVDKSNQEPLSLAKAKELNLKMAKLPLDRYCNWSSGSGKSLTLNQMSNILLDLKFTNDWEYSLRHVPKRKLLNEEREENKFQTKPKFKPRVYKKDEQFLDKILYNRTNKHSPLHQKRKIAVRSLFNDD